MTRTLLIPSLLLLSTVLATSPADAEPMWVTGPSQFIPFNCAPHGVVNGVETWVGQVNDTANPFKTGDGHYVAAVAKAAGPCTDGVSMEIHLPQGAIRDPNKPVHCIRQKAGTNPVLSDPIQNCAPSGFTGPNGGLMFTNGAVTLAPNWYLEIHIPVIYNAELLGSAGGVSHSLRARTMSTTAGAAGVPAAIPSLPISVGYLAKLENPAISGVTTNTATLAVDLISFYKGGQLSFEYGTTAAFGQSTNPGTVSSTYLYYTGSNATLLTLASSTTYYWRAKYVTNSGTFYSTTQSFATNYAAPIVLTVAKSGSGLGKITSNPVYFDCGSYSSNVCSANVAQGINITLYATPSTPAYVFTGWSGACTGTGVCAVSMNASKSITANFEFFDYRSATPLPGPTPRRL